VFPLVRHISNKTTAVLLRSPLTPNQLTSLSLVSGLAAAWLFASAHYGYGIAAALLLVVSYVLDNCDGEIARAKGLTSEFGRKFDDISDWWVHAALFIGIGFGVEAQSGNSIWWWFGIAAGAGATINYLIVQFLALRSDNDAPSEESAPDAYSEAPKEFVPLVIFVFRELFRADFCFLLLLLALFDVIWLILPAAAIGSQVYWMIAFYKESRKFHV